MGNSIYKSDIIFSDKPNGELKLEFKFYELSPETLTPIREISMDEATKLIEVSQAFKLANLLLGDLTEKLEKLKF